MNQPGTEQTIRDNEQLAELDVMYKETERALVLIGDRMREIKNRLQKKPPVGGEVGTGNRYLVGETPMPQEAPRDINFNRHWSDSSCVPMNIADLYTKLAGGKYEK